jgi:hypothetical protein
MLEDAPIPNAEAAGAALQAVEGLSAAVAIQKNINFQLGVYAKDKGTAEQFAKAGNGAIMMAKGVVAKRAETEPDKFGPAAEVVKTLRVTNEGNSIIVRGEITFETLGKILKNLPQQP